MINRDLVKQCFEQNPNQTMAEVARYLGITRERVRQIRKVLGLKYEYDGLTTIQYAQQHGYNSLQSVRNLTVSG